MFKVIKVKNKNIHNCALCGDNIDIGRDDFLENDRSFHPYCYNVVRNSNIYSNEFLGYFNPV